jgi:hypothetical protein
MRRLCCSCSGVALVLFVGACIQTDNPLPARTARVSPITTSSWSRVLAQVSIHPGGPERIADGPSAVAVTPDGSVLVLDRRAKQLLRVEAKGKPTVVSAAPWAAGDVAVSSDGAFALYSPLRARIWVHGPEGKLLGELAVPRALRMVRGVALEPSRQVWLQDAHQQRFLLGSPSLPQSLPAVLHSRREGAYRLSDGSGVLARVVDGVASVQVVREKNDRAHVVGTVQLVERDVLAARVVGTAGKLACLRLELAGGQGPAVTVRRRAVCLDTSSGVRVLDEALPPPWRYMPGRELATGGSPPRLATIHPGPDGLRVQVFALEGGER